MKTFNVFVTAYDGELDARLFEILAIDEELATSAARMAINHMWPDAICSKMIITEKGLCLDMLEPSNN
jgi:hypothetical protein